MQHTSYQAESSNTGRLPSRVNRKKDPKTKEDVWPHEIETHLIDALKEFANQKHKNRRSIFIKDYILKKTGETRSSAQISSRLQQIKGGKNCYLAGLVRATQRKSPTRPPYTQVFRIEPASHPPPNGHEGPSYEEIVSPLSTLSLPASPYSESLEAPLIQDEWVISDASSTAAHFNFNDDSLWEQSNPYNDNSNYLQEAATYTQINPSVGGEPNLDSVSLMEWFNSQYPNPGYQR